MSTTYNLVSYLEYDEGDMEIRIIDAVIHMGIHSWGKPLNLSLIRDGADLLITNAPNTACTGQVAGVTVTGADTNPEDLPVNGADTIHPPQPASKASR